MFETFVVYISRRAEFFGFKIKWGYEIFQLRFFLPSPGKFFKYGCKLVGLEAILILENNF